MPLSSVDAVAPAFAHARRQLFSPFRFGFWFRIAVIVMTTGDFYGSCTTTGGNYNFNIPNRRPGGLGIFQDAEIPHWGQLAPFLPYFIVGAIIIFALMLLWLYAASVFRFIFFDAVLTDRSALKEGWQRWSPQGGSYFLWNICFFVATLAVFGAVVGLPVFALVGAGIFRHANEHIGLIMLGIFVLALLLIALVLISAAITVFARDFVVPVMALENVGVLAAWRRVIPMLKLEKMAYAGYVLMRLVLVIGSAIIFGILGFLGLLLAAIPIGIVAVALVIIWKAAALTWSPITIGAAAIIGFAALTLIFYVFAFISAPAAVFFQAYSIHFFASRYPPLGQRLAPPAPPPVAPSPAPVPAPATMG
jgi:hypothetical protein